MSRSPRLPLATKQVDPDVLKRSVTAGDLPDNPQAGVLRFYFPLMPGSSAYDLLPFWTLGRDWQLFQTIYRESQWANAVTKAITKLTAKSFEVDGEVPARVRRNLDLLKHFDASRGWVPGLAKHLQAYLLTGNGGFLEIVRATKGAGSKIIGLVHLDTFRCVRTGDPEFPVIFRDRKGVEHVMRAHQVIMLSDQPDQAELWNGVGHCAAERAYRTICRLEAIETYVKDKVSGQRALAIHVISGISTKQLNEAIKGAKEDAAAKGMANFMGAVMMGSVTPEAPGVATIPLAELPDGFDSAAERKNAYLTYANALGIDPQMIDPDLIASRALGTGAQSRVIAEKQEVIGLAAWTKAFEHAINEYVLDEKTTFAFSESDLTEEERKAQITNTRATAISTLVGDAMAGSQVITPRQGLQMLVDMGEVPEEFLPEDETPDTSITDEEKPEGEEPAADVSTETPTEPPTQLELPGVGKRAVIARGTAKPTPKPATLRRARELVAAEYDAAVEIAKRLMSD